MPTLPERRPRARTELMASLFMMIVAVLGGCAKGGAAQPRPTVYGHIVLGPRTASEFGLKAGDTLPELSGRDVPSAVTTSARVDGDAAGFRPTCTRYFSGGRVFIALFVSACSPAQPRDDGMGMGSYTSRGERRGHILMTLSDSDYQDLSPDYR